MHFCFQIEMSCLGKSILHGNLEIAQPVDLFVSRFLVADYLLQMTLGGSTVEFSNCCTKREGNE